MEFTQNGLHSRTFIPLEFRHIGKPLRVWFRRMEITISNFAHPKQACNNAQQGNVTP